MGLGSSGMRSVNLDVDNTPGCFHASATGSSFSIKQKVNASTVFKESSPRLRPPNHKLVLFTTDISSYLLNVKLFSVFPPLGSQFALVMLNNN